MGRQVGDSGASGGDGRTAIRGFHIGDARLGSIRIFDARVKSQHDAQWRASNYQSRPITDFLMRASKFCRCVTNVKTLIGGGETGHFEVRGSLC